MVKLGHRIASMESFDPHYATNAMATGLLPVSMVNALGEELQDSQRQAEAHEVLSEMDNALDVANDLDEIRIQMAGRDEVSQAEANAVLEGLSRAAYSLRLYSRYEPRNPRYTVEALPNMRQRNFKQVVVTSLEGVIGDIWEGVKNFFKRIIDWFKGLFSSNTSAGEAGVEETKKIDEIAATTEKAAEAAGAGDSRATQAAVLKSPKSKDEFLAELNKGVPEDGKDGNEKRWKGEGAALTYEPGAKRLWIFGISRAATVDSLTRAARQLNEAGGKIESYIERMRKDLMDFLVQADGQKGDSDTLTDKQGAKELANIADYTLKNLKDAGVLTANDTTEYPALTPLQFKKDPATGKFSLEVNTNRAKNLAGSGSVAMPLMSHDQMTALSNEIRVFAKRFAESKMDSFLSFLTKAQAEFQKISTNTTKASADAEWAKVSTGPGMAGLDPETLAAKKQAFLANYSGNAQIRVAVQGFIMAIQQILKLLGHYSTYSKRFIREANGIYRDHAHARARLTAKFAHLNK